MDLPDRFRLLGPGISGEALERLVFVWTLRFVAKGNSLVRQGERSSREILLLDGRIASQISDSEGRSVCVGLYTGPAAVAPVMARTRDGVSLVDFEVTEDAVVAEIQASELLGMMISSSHVRDWVDGILWAELERKSDREWSLAALGGADRLAWFRDRYPDYEKSLPIH